MAPVPRRPRLRIVTALIGVLVIVSIVPLALSAIRLVSINREALETAEKQYLTRSAVTLSDGIEAYLRRMLVQVTKIGDGLELALAVAPDKDPFAFVGRTALIARYRDAEPSFLVLRALDPDRLGGVIQPAQVDEALDILLRTNPLPSVCGRVCPGFCMLQCNRAQLEGPVNVRALERYAGDHGHVELAPAPRRAERVAVIGAGPAGLSGAWQLARLGYAVTLFDAGSELGGLMRTGIPAYRLPREALDRDIGRILALGVTTVLDARIDHDRLQQMAHEFDAVLAATGLQRLTALDLGHDLGSGEGRIQQGIEFLDLARQGRVQVAGERVLVIGHNPGLEGLLQLLSGRIEALPTSTIAYLSLPVQRWAEAGEGELVEVLHPGDLRELTKAGKKAKSKKKPGKKDKKKK